MQRLWVFLALLVFLPLGHFAEGKTFCPACPQEKYVPSGMELEKIGVEKETVDGEERVRITLEEDGRVREVAVFFFDPEDFVSQRVRVFLEGLRARYPGLRLVEGDIREERVKEIKEALDSLFGIPGERGKQLPCLFIGGSALVGEWEIAAQVENILANGR